MNDSPGTEPGHGPEGRTRGPPGEPPSRQAGGFRASWFRPVPQGLFGVLGPSKFDVSRSEEPNLGGTTGSSPGSTSCATADAKAEADRNGAERREPRERRGDGAAGPSGPARGGGWERRVRVDGTAAGGRRPTAGERDGGAAAGEAVPSAGWREVVDELEASAGRCHR